MHLTLQNRGNMLYNLSSLSLSESGCGGCVYSENSFFRCIRPRAVCCGLELASSCAAAALDAPLPRSFRIMFIMLSTNITLTLVTLLKLLLPVSLLGSSLQLLWTKVSAHHRSCLLYTSRCV